MFPCISVLHKRGLLVMLVQRYKNIRATQTLNKNSILFFLSLAYFKRKRGQIFSVSLNVCNQVLRTRELLTVKGNVDNPSGINAINIKLPYNKFV